MTKLDPTIIDALKKRHRTEKSADVCDRIKAVILRDKGWSQEQIAEALLSHTDTVKRHFRNYDDDKRIKSEAGGSVSKLNESDTLKLTAHLEERTYTKVSEICAYVMTEYEIDYTVAGMTNWLHAHKFSYKKPKETPIKADAERQAEFIEFYKKLKLYRPENEPILFIDSVHPTMATKVSFGWIRTGKDKPIGTISSRTRMNLTGALDLENMNVQIRDYETINGENVIDFLKHVKGAYPKASKLHIVLDQAGYHKSFEVKEFALNNGIDLHYLPPYSPNLNPIERLWKVMNEKARNNVVFHSATEFRERIGKFFAVDYPQIAQSLVDRLTDNFRVITHANSF